MATADGNQDIHEGARTMRTKILPGTFDHVANAVLRPVLLHTEAPASREAQATAQVDSCSSVLVTPEYSPLPVPEFSPLPVPEYSPLPVPEGGGVPRRFRRGPRGLSVTYDGMDADQYIENLRTKVRMRDDMLTILKKATGVPSKPSRTKLSYITVDTMQAWAVKLVAYDACLAPITDPEGDMIEKMIGHGQRRTDDRGSGYVRSLSQREEDKKEGAMPYGLNRRDFAWIWKRAMYGIRDSPDGGPPTLNPPLNRQDGNWKMLLSNTFHDARDCGEDLEIGDLCFDILVSERFEMPQEEEEEEYDEY